MLIFEVFKSIVLGIIQGVTEWLPISSTGHMLIFNSLCPLDELQYGGGERFVNLFVVLIQFGSMLAVVFLFFNRLNPFSRFKNSEQRQFSFNLWKKVIIGTIPAVVVGFLFNSFIEQFLSGNLIIALTLIIYGIFFILVENSSDNFRVFNLNKLDYRTAFFVGLFQVLAFIPGTSRSGATILGALILGCVREVGAEFSFFLSIPTIAGASLLKTVSYIKHVGTGLMFNEVLILFIGCLSAFVVSVFVISAFMKFIKRHNFKVFAYYRIALGLLVLALIGLKLIKV